MHAHTPVQNLRVGKLFLKNLVYLFCSPRLYLFDQIYSRNGNIAKYYNLM